MAVYDSNLENDSILSPPLTPSQQRARLLELLHLRFAFFFNTSKAKWFCTFRMIFCGAFSVGGLGNLQKQMGEWHVYKVRLRMYVIMLLSWCLKIRRAFGPRRVRSHAHSSSYHHLLFYLLINYTARARRTKGHGRRKMLTLPLPYLYFISTLSPVEKCGDFKNLRFVEAKCLFLDSSDLGRFQSYF